MNRGKRGVEAEGDYASVPVLTLLGNGDLRWSSSVQ